MSASNLVEAMKVPCTMLEKTRVPDGEGGFTTGWRDGAPFMAAIALDSSTLARIAEKQGVSSLYTVTTSPDAHLDFHDVFRRDSDGQVFRVTSDGSDRTTPSVATFHFERVSAEEWVLS